MFGHRQYQTRAILAATQPTSPVPMKRRGPDRIGRPWSAVKPRIFGSLKPVCLPCGVGNPVSSVARERLTNSRAFLNSGHRTLDSLRFRSTPRLDDAKPRGRVERGIAPIGRLAPPTSIVPRGSLPRILRRLLNRTRASRPGGGSSPGRRRQRTLHQPIAHRRFEDRSSGWATT